ncbi:uncharacterized protein LTR77_001558 [Saxophila tyrrhenica]|uniref:Crh-like protein n=1 Tax=Saxophila tyrrhenica TaxID=1690608 RepID=A0AAV9PKS8_9PEZI|nr:hypothetical protein LTR77_001558 [Saxophila tyrrhenica]
MRFTRSAAVLAASLAIAEAQTFTDCNPTEKKCPADTGLPSDAFISDFTDGKGASTSWSAAAYSTINYGSQGAEFAISQPKQAPTIETDFYMFFGRVDVRMRAAAGTGIVSSIVLESDDLDEIDWEFVGGDTAQVQSNFFGKGNTTAYDRVEYIPVSNPQEEFHTYSIDWNSDRLNWIIDNKIVRTLTYDDPLTVGGKNYPQTPMRVKLGNWCGGCKGMAKGTVEWSGGPTTFENAPYTMYVESVRIQNANPADSYEYGDMSGSWESIDIIKGGKQSQPSGEVTPSKASVTQTSAPTKAHTVSKVDKTEAAVTLTGKYTMNGTMTGSHQAGGVKTSVVQATTQVPGAQPTDGNSPGGISPGSGSGPSPSSSAPPSTGAAAAQGVMGSSLGLGLLFSFLLL